MYNVKTILLFILILLLVINGQSQDKEELLSKIKQGIESGKIAYKLTETEEILNLLGSPKKERERRDGGMLLLEYIYPQLSVLFGKMRDRSAPFTLINITFSGKRVDIGENRKIVLRHEGDLSKFDTFWGFQDVSLAKLDLRDKEQLLRSMTFDSLTEWPSASRLPSGFTPAEMIEEGKIPGLRIKTLHEQGIDGRGVGLAIIDQKLLLGHEEYTEAIVRYDASGLRKTSHQMHGPPVASIAVGKNLGVAPAAELTYFAVPTWENDNLHYVKAIQKIFKLNEILPEKEKIRVISISDGAFVYQKNYDKWEEVLSLAEKQGIYIVTCDRAVLKYGTLSLIPGKDPDFPESYKLGAYYYEDDLIRIPTGNRTIASHRGDNVYTYEVYGGMSWGAPYLAGLAALAFQVDPNIIPEDITKYFLETVSQTPAGPVVNPMEFINRVRERMLKIL